MAVFKPSLFLDEFDLAAVAIVSLSLYSFCGFHVIFECDKELFCEQVCKSYSVKILTLKTTHKR